MKSKRKIKSNENIFGAASEKKRTTQMPKEKKVKQVELAVFVLAQSFCCCWFFVSKNIFIRILLSYF